MAKTIILKNTTGAAIDLDSIGVRVLAANQQDVSDISSVDFSNAPEVISNVQSGDIVVNDGTNDLSIEDGEAYLLNQVTVDPRFVGTGFATLPSGTTAQRPVTGADGAIRVNTTDDIPEFWSGGQWRVLSNFEEVDRVEKYYVGKNGNDSNDGLTPNKAFLTFGAAITAATAQTPSSSTPYGIICEDAGVYAESITVPSWVYISAPGATLQGNLTLSDNCLANFFEVVASSGNVVSKSGTTEAALKAGIVRATGSANAVVNTGTTSIMMAEVRQIFAENGVDILDSTTALAGHTHINAEDVYITGTGTGVDCSNNGQIVGSISHILEIGGGVGNGTAIELDDGTISLQVGRLETTTAYNASAGSLRLIVNNLTGARNQTSGTVNVDVLEANSLRWIPVTNADSPYTPRRIEYLNIDTTGGIVEIDLPATASGGDVIYFQDAAQSFSATNFLRFDGNGKTIDGSLSDLVVFVKDRSGQLVFNATTDDWSYSTNTAGASPENLIYVSKNGNDTYGTGSFDRPFLTVKKGADTAEALATSSLPVSVNILDGIYDEDAMTITNPYVTIKGNGATVVTIRPNTSGATLFTLSSSTGTGGVTLSDFTIENPTTGAGTAVFATGDGRFVMNTVPIIDYGVGIDAGNGTISAPNSQEVVYDYGVLQNNTIGAQIQDQAKLAIQVVFFRNNTTGLIANETALVEIGNFDFQGAEPDGFPQTVFAGTGIVLNDNVDFSVVNGRVRNHVTGLIVNDTATARLGSTFFNNTTDFNQVDATASIIMTGGSLNKDSLLIADGENIALDYFDNETTDFIVGSADATNDPGKEFRVRQTDGRVFIGDAATNEHGQTNTVGGARSINLIDSNGNIRIWRYTIADAEDPSIEWIKGVSPAVDDGEGDAPISSIAAGTDTITVDVSGTDFNEPLDPTPGIGRSSLAERAFPVGRVFRVNGTASNDGDYIVVSSTYNSGPETIDVVVSTDITTSEGAVGEVIFGGGAGRPDGVSTYVGDPGSAVAMGTGNIHWDMFLQEDDYLVFRHRTGGGGGTNNEKVRLYPDRSEWLGATTYGDSDNEFIFVAQHTAGADAYVTLNNGPDGSGFTDGPQLVATGAATDINFRFDPKGSGNLILDGLKWPNTDGTNGQVLQTDGAGNLSWGSGSTDTTGDTILPVNQPTHGFSQGDIVYQDSADSQWKLAQSDNVDTLGVASVDVVDTNNFNAVFAGRLDGLSGLTAGEYYFVSDTVAGTTTNASPTNPAYSNPVWHAISATEAIVLPWRPNRDEAASGGGGGEIEVQDNNSSVATDVSVLNFGSNLTVTDNGSGKVTVDAAGSSNAIEQGKHTIWVHAASMVGKVTNGADFSTAEIGTAEVIMPTYDFDATTNESIQFHIAMPKSWNEGTVSFQFLWTRSAAGSGDVVWSVRGMSLGDGDAIDGTWGTAVTVTDTADAVNDLMTSTETAAVTIGNTPTEGDMVVFEVTRNATAGGDTLGVDAQLIGVRFFHTINAATDA